MISLFTTILNMSMTASIVALGVIWVRFLLQKAKMPKIFSYALWLAVLFRLVFPFSIESIFSLMPTFVNELSYEITQNIQPLEISAYATMENISQNPGPSTNTAIHNAFPNASTDVFMPNILEIAGFVWLTGCAVLLIYAVVGYLRLKKRVEFATLMTDNIFETDKIKTPFVLGFIRPKIYFPTNVAPSQYDYILKHEQTHIKRLDYLIKPLAYILLALHWFNPIIWLSYFLMANDMEMSCDETVLRKAHADVRKDYSYSLLHLATEKNSLLSPISFGASNVKERVINVLNFKKTKMGLMAASVIIVAFVLVACSLNPVTDNDSTTPITRAEGPIISERFEVEDFTGIKIDGFYDVVFRYADEHAIVLEMAENLFDYVDFGVQREILAITPRRGTAVEWGTIGRPQITIYAPYIERVILDGGSLTATGWDTIVAESFTIEASGFNEIDIELEVEQLHVNLSGSNNITLHGRTNVTENLFIEASGFNEINIELEVEQLHVNMSGSNDIELSGTANVADITLDGFGHFLAFNFLIQEAQIQTSGSSRVDIHVAENLDITAEGFSEVRYMGDPFITPNISDGASISRME